MFTAFNNYAQEAKLMLPLGHTNAVVAASFSPDGKSLLTASYDKTAKIWNAESGQLLLNITGHTDLITSASFSPDGASILTSSYDKTAKIWSAKDGSLISTLSDHPGLLSKACFSHDGKYIITGCFDEKNKTEAFRIWNSQNYQPVTGFIENNFWFHDKLQISPTENEFLIFTKDSSLQLREMTGGQLKFSFNKTSFKYSSARYSSNGKWILTDCSDSTIRIWDALTLKKISEIHLPHQQKTASIFNTDGSLIFANFGRTAVYETQTGNLAKEYQEGFGPVSLVAPNGKIGFGLSTQPNCSWCYYTNAWDLDKGKRIDSLDIEPERNAWAISPDGSRIAIGSSDNTTMLWDLNKKKKIYRLKFRVRALEDIYTVPEKNLLVLDSWDDLKEVWDASRLKFIENSNKYTNPLFIDSLTHRGVFQSSASNLVIVDLKSDSVLLEIKGSDLLNSTRFSPDGKHIVVGYAYKNDLKIWNATTGVLELTIVDSANNQFAKFSNDGNKILSFTTLSTTPKIWNSKNGHLLAVLKGHSGYISYATFSPDGNLIAASSADSSVIVWDTLGRPLQILRNEKMGKVWAVYFSHDNKKLLTKSDDYILRLWDVKTGNLLSEMKGHTSDIGNATFSKDDKFIFSVSHDNTAKAWDTKTGKLLLTFFKVDSTDYLVTDNYGRYDGTEAARKLLYFTCGTEVIGLDQVKDKLWVPNLAERIMKGDTINAPKLAELEICNLTPLIETKEETKDRYQFQITPRRGGLGDIIVSVNNIESFRLNSKDLLKNEKGYLLTVDKKAIEKYFATGETNNINVKALTASNDISSRSTIVEEEASPVANKAAPNLYAVVVGVSDYKGTELDLRYAAKDADDIAGAITVTAKKLFNTDDKNHVFVYKLHTADGHDLFPEKNSIKKIINDIGSKAQPNDVLLIFFAGHGKWDKDKNQFFFLTADASKETVTTAISDVGISMQELTDWIQPAKMKAQKRILVFDACNSGQAIKDLVKIGNDDQKYLAARDDEKAEQIKAVEKLNNKSGLFILSASASNQYAYEMGKYSQGLLTYSLLKAIKEQPEILEDQKYLSVYRWFDAAEKTVSDIASQSGNQQQPQLVSTTNFAIGVVDDEVRNKIILPGEKPVFAASNFQNSDEDIAADNLGINKLVDNILADISTRSTDNKISYLPYSANDAYNLSGRYTVDGAAILLKVNIRKNNKTLYKFEVKGTTDKPEIVAQNATTKAIEWLSIQK